MTRSRRSPGAVRKDSKCRVMNTFSENAIHDPSAIQDRSSISCSGRPQSVSGTRLSANSGDSYPSQRNARRAISNSVVFPDTNVLVAYVLSKSDNSLVCTVFDMVRESDTLVVTNQVLDELYRIDLSKKTTTGDITKAMRRLNPALVFVRNPSESDLRMFTIDDPNDRKILYSADKVNAAIILTNDAAWFRDNVSGVDAQVMDLMAYCYQDKIRDGSMVFKKPDAGRIRQIRKRRV